VQPDNPRRLRRGRRCFRRRVSRYRRGRVKWVHVRRSTARVGEDEAELSSKAQSRVPLGRCLCTHHHERACGRASWTGDRSLVDEGDSPSARTAVCDDQNLVLVTLASARCRLAVGAHDPQRAFATRCSRSARRSRRTLRALRPRWSRWARRPCRTDFGASLAGNDAEAVMLDFVNPQAAGRQCVGLS
jgi:hypothetical protein